MDNGSQDLSEPSFVSLLGGIANDAKELLLQEVALTKLAVQYELRKAKTAAIALSIGIGTVATGMGIPEYEAKRYEGKIKEVGRLISVHSKNSDDVKRAKEIFEQAGAHDISYTEEKGVPKHEEIRV